MSASAAESSRQEMAIAELAALVAHVGEELTGFRRRAHHAEARVRELEGTPSTRAGADIARLNTLEKENGVLRARLEEATTRTSQLLERTRFLRQQREEDEQP